MQMPDNAIVRGRFKWSDGDIKMEKFTTMTTTTATTTTTTELFEILPIQKVQDRKPSHSMSQIETQVATLATIKFKHQVEVFISLW